MKRPENIPGIAIAPMDRLRYILEKRPNDIDLERAYVNALFAMTNLTRMVEDKINAEVQRMNQNQTPQP
jgi:hypothetical protein